MHAHKLYRDVRWAIIIINFSTTHKPNRCIENAIIEFMMWNRMRNLFEIDISKQQFFLLNGTLKIGSRFGKKLRFLHINAERKFPSFIVP